MKTQILLLSQLFYFTLQVNISKIFCLFGRQNMKKSFHFQLSYLSSVKIKKYLKKKKFTFLVVGIKSYLIMFLFSAQTRERRRGPGAGV